MKILATLSIISLLLPVAAKAESLVSDIVPLRDTQISGQIVFEQLPDKRVVVKYLIQGLIPGYHALHIHEKGDCSGKDGKTTGKHLRREGQIHGFPSEAMNHHAGDLPELYADADGVAFGRVVIPEIPFGSEGDGILGKGMMVHLNPDHFGPDKVPNKRVACGVVREANKALPPAF
jgi:Cu-Zn family superoxide dismutase